ncbi:MAG: DUF4105 domain-containing protein, partial [Paramuribaculum sp.]|nr:DUF4105 domain-containing protein [Paramuribaculum sp.]
MTMRSACVKAIIAVAAILFGLPPYALSQPAEQIRSAAPDSTRTVRLLTAAPGNDIYELEGHAALRLKSTTYDMTVNWGLFDFDSPNFVYRFVKGETDYMAGAIPTAYFIEQYRREGRRLKEQTLNLTPEEADRLRELVEINLLPETRTYSYNYVKDNCSTRCIDIVERAIGDSLHLGTLTGDLAGEVSFRDMMAYHHRNYPWYQFGIDLALGKGIDYPITNRQKAFAPTILERQAEQALRPDGTPLTLGTNILVAGEEHGTALGPTPWWLTPLAGGGAVFAIVLSVTVADIARGSTSRWLDSMLFGIMALTGCIIAFLVFISVHEATSPNWLILWLNPLCFIPAIFEWSRRCRTFLICYHFLNFAAILTMVIFMVAGEQNCNSAFIPLIACSALRSISYIYISLCGKRKELTYSIKYS